MFTIPALPTLADAHWSEISQLPYWGFDWRDYGVTAVSRAQGDSPGSTSGEYEVITGTFDFEQITASIAACEECVEPTTGTLLGVHYLRWEGNSVEERNSPPFFRLGFPGHYVTVQDGVLYTAWNEYFHCRWRWRLHPAKTAHWRATLTWSRWSGQ